VFVEKAASRPKQPFRLEKILDCYRPELDIGHNLRQDMPSPSQAKIYYGISMDEAGINIRSINSGL